MNAKRKSTLGTRPRPNIEAPRRLTTILNLIPDVETDDESRNRNVTQHVAKRKQPRSNKVSAQTTSNKGSARRPVNTMYKRTALKPANSTAVRKESTPRAESLKGQMGKSKLLKNNEETSTGGLRMMRERAARARAARILSTPNSNIARRGEIMGNRTPLYIPLAQLTPQNLHFTKYNSDFPCSADRNIVAKRQCKSTSAYELLSCDAVSLQSKQKIFVDENRMEHMRTNVTESHFGNENQENLAQENQKPGGTSYKLTADELQKENITNCYQSIQISSPFQSLKPSILQTDIPHNFTSAYNDNMGISQTKPIIPRLSHIPALPSGHLKTTISSQDTSSVEMQPPLKSQAPEPKPPNISCSRCNTENILNVPFETNSASQNSYEEGNNFSNKNDKDVKVKVEAEAAALNEGTESVKGGAHSLKEPHVMEILKNMLNLQQQCKTEMEHFMEKMKAIQNQQFEMLQKLVTVCQAAEERDECKQRTSATKESKPSFSTDMSIEMDCADFTEAEKMLGLIVSGKKKRRSSRIATKLNGSARSSAHSSAHSNTGTPDPCDMHTAVVAKYKDLQKSFTFLRTPRSCKTPLEGRIPTRTPRTIVSTSIRTQLQLLYDTDSSQ